MSLRFPGQAVPASVPIAWDRWTVATPTLRFGGAATAALTELRWTDWVGGSSAPPPTPSPTRPKRVQPSSNPPPATSASLPLGTAELARALARSQNAATAAHGTFLASQHRHLAELGALHQRLAALADLME